MAVVWPVIFNLMVAGVTLPPEAKSGHIAILAFELLSCEYTIHTTMDYVALLMQWLFLFAFLSVMIVPGLKLMDIAREKGERGWPYMLAGMAIGLVTTIAVFQIMRLMRGESESSWAMAFVGLVVAHVVAYMVVTILHRRNILP